MAPVSKAVIILAWLMVPIAASLFMRNSYANYIDSCTIQRQNCELRAWHVDQYSRELNTFAPNAGEIRSPADHIRWLQDFDEIRQRQAQSSSQLDLGKPEYYQATDAELIKLEISLADLFRTIEDAALVRLDYVRSADRLIRLEELERELEANSYYYKRVGMEGIYIQMQEELAIVEKEIRSRKRQRSGYLSEVSDLLGDADTAYRVIQRGLNHIGERLEEDEEQTFRNQLHNRVAEFSLTKELSGLIDPT